MKMKTAKQILQGVQKCGGYGEIISDTVVKVKSWEGVDMVTAAYYRRRPSPNGGWVYTAGSRGA